MNVRAGLNGNIDGRWLIMLLVITSKYPNTEVILTRARRMKKRPTNGDGGSDSKSVSLYTE